MLFEVTHTTLYTYNRPVALGPHVIRLKPRCDGSQRLLDFTLRIEPEPVAISECLDWEGNVVTHAWFSGDTDRLQVVSAFTVETLRSNPGDFFLEPDFARLPANYREPVQVSPYRSTDLIDGEVRDFAASLIQEAGSEPLTFLSALNERLFRTFRREIRPQGEPQSPQATLALGKGACRDLTVLFMAVCHTQGLAVRFVSGYHRGDGRRKQRYLHAWPEVYLPGGGWRGYDPTRGQLVADEHVPLAAARIPAGTMPIEGTFSGQGVASTLDFTLKIVVS